MHARSSANGVSFEGDDLDRVAVNQLVGYSPPARAAVLPLMPQQVLAGRGGYDDVSAPVHQGFCKSRLTRRDTYACRVDLQSPR